MHSFRSVIKVLLLVALSVTPLHAGQPQDWSFEGVDRVDIDGVSGHVIVQGGPGAGVSLSLDQDVSPDGAFRAEVDMSGGTLRVRERWGRGSSRGSVTWNLTIPSGADLLVSVDTASGDLEASGVNARFDFSTASGDVRLSDMTVREASRFSTASGDLVLTDVMVGDVQMSTASGNVELLRVRAAPGFEASTASGNVLVDDSEGVLEASTASGRVRVSDSRMTGPSEFSSASGDVTVVLDDTLEHDLEASSASGDVSFEAAFGNDFTLVMTKRRDRGSIDSPFEATNEEEFERNGRTYVRQTVVRGSGGPQIRLDSASGSIRVRQR